jgi:bifunctional UDP-N-acetylglucosamine pyrophosphorylase/glucosamine-1-phosphate N-acetyltransferase
VSISAVILAAGKGTRMKSELPKPLHAVRGLPLLAWVVHALDLVGPKQVAIVVGHGRSQVIAALDAHFERPFLFAEQKSQRGTGDAAAVGLAELDLHDGGYDHVLVLPGDTPLLTAETVAALVEQHRADNVAATVVTSVVDDPAGYGRIIRADSNTVAAIVEHRDATTEQRAIREINGGIYCFRRSMLAPALRMISTENAQGEQYLTDAVGVLVEAGHRVMPFAAAGEEIAGVNDRAQLSAVAGTLGDRIARRHLLNGVTIVQPSSTVIDARAVIESDVSIHAGTVIEGETFIGTGATVGPNAHLVDARIGDNAVVECSTVRDATVAPGQVVGPYTVLTSNGND